MYTVLTVQYLMFYQGYLWDRFGFSQSRCSGVRIQQYMPCSMYRTLDLSACSAICRRAQAKAPVGMHSVKAYVMPFHTVILQNYILKIWQSYINWYAQNFDSFNYTAGSWCRPCGTSHHPSGWQCWHAPSSGRTCGGLTALQPPASAPSSGRN